MRFEWHSIGHIATSESYRARPGGKGRWDYVHLNSIAVDAEGNFILSARATHTVYKVSRLTGNILWRLGGRKSSFRMGSGAQFALQHDARLQPDGTITLFDNSSSPPVRKHSRAITLKLDGNRATLQRALLHPDGLLSATQGSMQILPTGNTFVGWGSRRWFTEYDATGKIVLDGRLAAGNDTYRAYRFTWNGMPDAKPKVVEQPRLLERRHQRRRLGGRRQAHPEDRLRDHHPGGQDASAPSARSAKSKGPGRFRAARSARSRRGSR